MAKYNNYKKYYETHTEQEKKRFHDYYYANRERILAERREKRKNAPKKVKLTPIDYQTMWLEMYNCVIHNTPFIAGLMRKFENDRLEKKKEMLKDENKETC